MIIVSDPKKIIITTESGLRVTAFVDYADGGTANAILDKLYKELKDWQTAPACYKRPAPVIDVRIEEIPLG